MVRIIDGTSGKEMYFNVKNDRSFIKTFSWNSNHPTHKYDSDIGPEWLLTFSFCERGFLTTGVQLGISGVLFRYMGTLNGFQGLEEPIPKCSFHFNYLCGKEEEKI